MRFDAWPTRCGIAALASALLSRNKGQKPVAFVVPEPGRTLDEAEVKRFALANAPAYQHPRFVWVLDRLPLASTNKIDRSALRRLAHARVRRAQ
jgi:long-chain acyl-CoA synthetase